MKHNDLMTNSKRGILLRPLSPIMVSLLLAVAAAATPALGAKKSASPKAIPWAEVGAAAGTQYSGEGLSLMRTEHGARLHCVFQRLDGEATPEGLWMTSTVPDLPTDHFRVKATAVGRTGGSSNSLSASVGSSPVISAHTIMHPAELPATGEVCVDGQTVRFIRPGLVEEYSVSMDGVRQDFVVLGPPQTLDSSSQTDVYCSEAPEEAAERPVGGQLRVELAVTGARVESLPRGARLVLDHSGRKIAYSRLRVTDASGRELLARMDGVSNSEIRNPKPEMRLAVVVNDSRAVYPIRIDPTFSDENWVSMSPSLPGADNSVLAAAVDGSGNLYIGGIFNAVGDVIAHGIAKWNGSSWTGLGSGIVGGFQTGVYALAVSGNDVYAGGYFTTAGGMPANYIAKWNGSSWSELGSGMNDAVYSLAVSGSNLYAGGHFTSAGGSTANRIAKWNGNSWSALGSGMTGTIFFTPSVYALALWGNDLYAGGEFTTAGGVEANYVAKWDGNTWGTLGSGMGVPFGPGAVRAIAVSGNDLYAGGEFTTAGGVTANSIAKWDGKSWSALGNGTTWAYTGVRALAVSGTNLYAGGDTTVVLRWDGSNWSATGSGMSGTVYFTPGVAALVVLGNDLYAGGHFNTAGGNPANYVAKWDGNTWSPLGSGMNPTVYAVAVSGSDLYVGGDFTTAGGVAANRIAKWNGTAWSPLGSGIPGSIFDPPVVYALAVLGGDLYAAGRPRFVMKWNGSAWNFLDDFGVNGAVYTLAVLGGDLYAGGAFTTAGGSHAGPGQAAHIARWDGSSWSQLGSGMVSIVRALVASGSDLYAGGDFTSAGGVAANRVAKWNGNAWSALGSGMNGSVYGLAVSSHDLYAGGAFTTADGMPANYISKWNGSNWSDLGSGMNNWVYALAVSGSDLYAGGLFTTAGGNTATRIAKWNGSAWSALGSGMNGPVYGLAVSSSDLFAGGDFTIAGGKVSAYIARAYLLPFPILSIQRSGTNVSVAWPSSDTDGFTLEQSGILGLSATWVSNTATVTDNGTQKSVTLPGTDNAEFLRLRRP